MFVINPIAGPFGGLINLALEALNVSSQQCRTVGEGSLISTQKRGTLLRISLRSVISKFRSYNIHGPKKIDFK